jgi:hypothetical protein
MSRLRSLQDMVLGIGAETLFAAVLMAWAGVLCYLALLLYP